ncbi:MAG: zf-TFIIB domain-containing protein [Pirellulales bacterium]|nr:zf-TFIIB domain-containing protein [Pirellulales bacterium]
MKCPVCNSELKRLMYEGFAVFRCMNCHGYLLSDRRIESIKRSNKRGQDLLKQEVIEESGADTLEEIRCPRCRRKMKKKFIPEPASLHLDRCADCEMSWFDGGELARLQLTHEISLRGRDAAEFRRRHEEMTPQRKIEFEENLKKLDSGEEMLGQSFFKTLLTLISGPRKF